MNTQHGAGRDGLLEALPPALGEHVFALAMRQVNMWKGNTAVSSFQLSVRHACRHSLYHARWLRYFST